MSSDFARFGVRLFTNEGELMDYELQLVTAFEDARKLIRECRVSFANVNEFAWDKLHRVDVYLCVQQQELGKRFFAARDEFSQGQAESCS